MAFINGKQVLFSPQVNVTNVEGTDVDVVQETGTSETAVMSQKAASLSFANALKGSKSGELVTLSDVSPVPHEVKLKVTGVADPTTVTISAVGKNLFDKQSVTTVPITSSGGCAVEQVENGIECIQKGPFQYPNNSQYFRVEGGKQYTLSAAVDNATYTPRLLVFWFDAEMKGIGDKQMSWKTGEGKQVGAFTAPSAAVFAQIRINGGTVSSGGTEFSVTFSEIQFEIGASATDYEAYVEHHATVNEDGTVEGLLAISPVTNLCTDTAGATIACEYNRDINKAFAELQTALISLGGNV